MGFLLYYVFVGLCYNLYIIYNSKQFSVVEHTSPLSILQKTPNVLENAIDTGCGDLFLIADM